MVREKLRRGSWHRRQVTCGAVNTAAADDLAELSRSHQRHVRHCLRCQADLAQLRKLRRALYGLRAQVMEPPPALVGGVIAALDGEPALEPSRSLLSGRRIVYAGGLAAATAAGAVSAIVFTARSRRTRLAG